MGTVSSDPAKKNVLLLERKETLVLRGLNEHPALKSYAVYQMPWLVFYCKEKSSSHFFKADFFYFLGAERETSDTAITNQNHTKKISRKTG